VTSNRLEPSAEAGPDAAQRPSATELVAGIVADAQTLIRQQVIMLRAELHEDLRRTKEAAKYMGLGVALAAIGGLFLLVGVVNLLNWLAPSLPLWACWAIVGGVLLAGGLIAVYAGKRIFDSFHPLSDKTAHALEENISWLTNRRN
jgi:hypothetical protein